MGKTKFMPESLSLVFSASLCRGHSWGDTDVSFLQIRGAAEGSSHSLMGLSLLIMQQPSPGFVFFSG